MNASVSLVSFDMFKYICLCKVCPILQACCCVKVVDGLIDLRDVMERVITLGTGHLSQGLAA